MSYTNAWTDDHIVKHSSVDHEDPDVRAAAEAIHRNESLHRHDPMGVTCIYCALVATRAVRVMRQRGYAQVVA